MGFELRKGAPIRRAFFASMTFASMTFASMTIARAAPAPSASD